MKNKGLLYAAATAAVLFFSLAAAEKTKTRDEQVHDDRDQLKDDSNWIYNDLSSAKEAARSAGKPMMIVFRCIP